MPVDLQVYFTNRIRRTIHNGVLYFSLVEF